MLDARIKINNEELTRVSSNLSQRIAELEDLIKRLEALLNRIRSSWTGASCDAYIAMMTKYLNDAKNHVNLLNSFKSYIDDVINRFNEWDTNSASQIARV